MKIVPLKQGAPEWDAHRATHDNASDAPAMMGCSEYESRSELLRRLHTGITAIVNPQTQRLFDEGHRFEALCRPLAEGIVQDDLYAIVGTLGRMSASFDGCTLDAILTWEHKRLNKALCAVLPESGIGGQDVGAMLPLMYRVQMEHQAHVSGCERVLFSASNWADDGALIEARHCWYAPDAELRAALLQGWERLHKDLAAYVPPVIAEPARAEPMESLPAVSVRLDGALSVAGNLPAFSEALRAFIARMPVKPATDNDFATTEAACKALKKAEEALDAAEAGALASITDVEAMRRAVADCRKLARDTRLAAEKMVERRKTEVKEGAVANARKALDAHIADLNGELAPMRLQPVAADFAGAIKGLRSIASMQDALDTALANGKIAADAQARLIRANVATFKGAAAGLEFLFSDLSQIVHKAADDFAVLVSARITTHRAAEAERERKRKADEEARIAAEAKRLADEAIRQAEAKRQAEELAAQRAESARLEALAAENRARLAAQQAASAPASAPAVSPMAAPIAAAPVAPTSAPAPAAPTVKDSLPVDRRDEPATLKLGVICERLGVTMTAQFLADVLHVRPARVDGASRLFTESQYLTICRQLQSHVGAMAEMYAGEPA